MTYFADSDSSGNIIAYYSDEFNYPEGIPSTAVQITDVQWQDTINNTGKYIIQNRELVLTAPPTDAELLEKAKEAKIAELKQTFGVTLLHGFTSLADGTSRVFGFSAEDSTHWDWIRGMTNAPNCPSSIPAKDINGNRLSLSISQAQQLCLDAQTFYLNTYTHWDSREQDAENATTIEEINAIMW